MTVIESFKFFGIKINKVNISLFGTNKYSFDGTLLVNGRDIFVCKFKIKNSKNGISGVVIKDNWCMWQMSIIDSPKSDIFSSTRN